MKKETKAFLAIAGIAAVGYFVWKAQSSAQTNIANTGTTGGGGNVCPPGQTPCPTGGGCYDPLINYLVNPCTGTI